MATSSGCVIKVTVPVKCLAVMPSVYKSQTNDLQSRVSAHPARCKVV